MSRENFDNYDQEERTYHAGNDFLNSELLEKKDPAIDQHENDTTSMHGDTSEHYNPLPDERDPDADRRTLDEEKAVEDEDQDN